MHAAVAPSSKRQLRLPGLDREIEQRKTARRDFTATEFKRALERNGFVPSKSGLCFVDMSGTCTTAFDAILHRDPPLRVRRRATLAKILRERARDVAKATGATP